MVRFGAHFRDVVDPTLAEYGVPYKRLKKQIKEMGRIRSTPDSQAVTVIGRATEDSTAFRAWQVPAEKDLEKEFTRELEICIAGLNQLFERELAQTPDELECQRLKTFGDLNKTAILKIVKKYEKKVGPCDDLKETLDRLPGQPFLNLLETRQSLPPPDHEVHWGNSAPDISGRVWHLRLTKFVLAQKLALSVLLLGVFVLFLGCLDLDLLSRSAQGVLQGVGLLLLIVTLGVLAMRCLTPRLRPPTVQRLWERISYSEEFDLMQREKVVCSCVNVYLDDTETVRQGCHRARPAFGNSSGLREFDVERGIVLSECSCCLDVFKPGDTIAVLPCAHAFHEACIVDWAATATEASTKCPQCRSKFDW
eukprot:TRINITY_DN61216_c0_g1_i1.p1 TRINITY_DN61216_c0_g1~~TRINITY_DN61216_c0_g1_i1.p1  ORF type:complete len:395 (+),score=43.19 TRINITY_DN61216_c0_g1_i1:91-1185(+)